MSGLIAIFVVGIITCGIYGIFELFVRRNERLAIIEKLSVGIDPSLLKNKVKLFISRDNKFWAVRIGCLLIGVGLGVFIVSIVELTMGIPQDWDSPINQSIRTMYPASAALFGGLGLILAYFIEKKQPNKEEE